MLPSDNHVHTRWSWDTAAASTMERSCARAVEHGIPAVAFTEHIDFTEWTDGDGAKRTKWVITDTEIGVSLRFTTVEVARDRREQPASPN